MLSALYECGNDLGHLQEQIKNAITDHARDDWTTVLRIGGSHTPVLPAGALPFVKGYFHTSCNEYTWLEWLSNLDGGDESLLEIHNTLKRMQSKIPSTAPVDLLSLLETVVRLMNLNSSFDVSHLLLNCQIDSNTTEISSLLHPMTTITEACGDAIPDSVTTMAIDIIKELVRVSENIPPNTRAGLLVLVASLIKKIPYTDPIRMDVFFHLSHLKGIDASTARLVPQRIISGALLNGIPDRRQRSLLDRRIQETTK